MPPRVCTLSSIRNVKLQHFTLYSVSVHSTFPLFILSLPLVKSRLVEFLLHKAVHNVVTLKEQKKIDMSSSWSWHPKRGRLNRFLFVIDSSFQ